MPTFSITIPAADRTQTPGETGKIDVSYTITNTKKTPVRATFKIVPKDATQRGWLSPEDGGERDFRPDESQQFKASVSIPPATPESIFGFRVDVANVADPARDCTEGDWIEVKWKPAPITNGRPFPWAAIIVAAVVVIAVGIVLAIVLHKKSKEPTAATQPTTAPVVPTSTTMATFKGNNTKFTDVETAVTKAGLKFDVKLQDDNSAAPVGAVLDQYPEPGEPIPADGKVILFVKETKVPQNLVGGPLDKALFALQGAQLQPGHLYGNPGTNVASTTPPAGTALLPNSPVDISLQGGHTAIDRSKLTDIERRMIR